ncbi:MAG: HprK-related kinase A [Nitrospirota bacterium]|jgi:HprK-related kinase A
MKISDLPADDLAVRLRGPGIHLRTGPFVCHLRSPIRGVATGLHLLYGDHALSPDTVFADFHVQLTRPKGLRRWLRPQVVFHFDDQIPFKPLPLVQAFPMLEWGLNWCVANHAHQYLVVHAAAVAKDDWAIIMPAPPGSGKSTLCAGLVARGWRLLSDELTLISVDDGLIAPLPRPVSLKNQSIEVMRQFAPRLSMTDECHDTLKGTVAHMGLPYGSIARGDTPARPAWIVFPRYQAGSDTSLAPRKKGETLLQVAQNGFNYSILGRRAFDLLTDTVGHCACYDFTYSRLAEAIDLFDALEPVAAPTAVAV